MGRDDELRVALAQCATGGVLFRGAPGVGTSRLATEVLERLGHPAHVRIRATAATSRVPLGAVAHLVDDGGAEPGTGVGADPGDRGAAAMAAVLRSILASGGDDGAVTVRVDDAHLLDELSAALMVQVALSGRAVLVMTTSTRQAAPDPVDLLWRDELVGVVEVAPLDARAVDELLGLVLVGGIDGRASRALRDAAGENLVHLRELVNGSIESGLLTNRRGHWELLGPLVAPGRLGDMVEHRLRRLGTPARRLLESIALAGPIGTAAAQQQQQGNWALVEELVAAGLVVVVEDGRRRQLQPADRLHAEVALSAMSDTDRRATLEALATAMESHGCRRRDDVRRLADWRMELGGAVDADVLLRAARQALADRDIDAALRCATSAMQLEGLSQDQRLEAALLRGRGLEEVGRLDEAEQLLRIFEPISGTGRLRVDLARCRSTVLMQQRGKEWAAWEVLDRADAVVSDPELRRQLDVHRSAFAAMAGQVERVLDEVAPLVDGPKDAAACEAMLMGAVGHTLAGRSVQGADLARRAVTLRHQLGGQELMSSVLVYEALLALALADAGRLIEAAELIDPAYARAVERSDRLGQGWLAGASARVELCLGRPLDSLHRAREASLVFGETAHPAARWALSLMAMAASHLGDLDTVTAVVEDLDAEPPAEFSILDVEVNRGRIWGLVPAGRIATARTALTEVAGRARGMGQHGLEAAVLHDVARLGDASAVRDRLVELAALVEGDLMAARVAHVRALVDDDGPALDRCTELFVQLGCPLFASETAAAAAAAHRRSGAERAAGASEFVARRQATQCQGAETPAMRLAPAAEELTRREREVAELAATGWTNRQIADELVVSVRTVENHLQRAYAKVGVGSREELASVLGRTGPAADSV